MYAVIRTGNKQHSVETGARLRIEKLAGDVGASLEFAEVLLVDNGETVKVGRPLVSGATVSAKILRQDKAARVVIFKKRRRKGFHKKRGHRQPFTEVEITGISPA
ncbi:MAG: 50S ribosomal protein L21 [Deltaproteobacteria bacterium]|nr:50S ribosomal protein L21 [Deltaproteobacteria bacterium]